MSHGLENLAPASAAPLRWLRFRAVWFVIALFVFLSFLGRTPITTDHERRVAETAAIMARSGWPWAATPVTVQIAGRADPLHVNPWLVPIFEDQVRLQKPPLPYWCAAVVDRLFGVGPGSARFVPALLGAVSSLLVYQLGRRVGGRHVGFVALLAWISTHFVVDEFRKAMADPYLAAFTLAAIVAWVEASLCVDRRRAGRWLIAAYAAVGMAGISKGPPVFLHLAIALGAFTFCFRRVPRVSIVSHAVGLLAFAAIALPWPLYILTHVSGAGAIWRNELDNDHNARPFYFYLHSPFLLSLPWTYAWIAGVVLAWQRRSRRPIAFVHLWLLATLICFSFAHMKKNAYLLPASPAIAIGAAQAVVRGIAFARRGGRRDQAALVAWIHTGVGIAVAGVIAVMMFTKHDPRVGIASITVAATACIVALLPLLTKPGTAFGSWVKVQSLAFAALIGLFIAFPEGDKKATRPPPATTNPSASAPIQRA